MLFVVLWFGFMFLVCWSILKFMSPHGGSTRGLSDDVYYAFEGGADRDERDHRGDDALGDSDSSSGDSGGGCGGGGGD